MDHLPALPLQHDMKARASFFRKTSHNRELSYVRSATRRLSFEFSSSSRFNRRVSAMPISQKNSPIGKA